MVDSLWCSTHTLPSKQPFWDRPGVLADRAIVESSLTTPLHRASFLAASSPHSGDWLFAMPITSCGLRLDDEASWVTGSGHYLETIVKLAFCFNAFLLLYCVSTLFCCGKVFSADSRSEDDLEFYILFSLIFSLPRELLPRVKK